MNSQIEERISSGLPDPRETARSINLQAAGIKLIRHNMGGVDNSDDPGFGPWRLDAVFRVPEFMAVAASFIYGREEICLRGKTKEALDKFAEVNELKTHCRLQSLTITQPESKLDNLRPQG